MLSETKPAHRGIFTWSLSYSIFSKVLFLFFACACARVYAPMCISTYRGQKRVSDTLGLKFQAVGSCLTQVQAILLNPLQEEYLFFMLWFLSSPSWTLFRVCDMEVAKGLSRIRK